MDDLAETLFGPSEEAAAEVATPEPEIVQPQPDAPIVEPEAAVPEKEEAKQVPLGTFLDVRDSLKEEKRARQEAERRVAEFENRQQTTIDPFDDPSGFVASQETKLQQALAMQKFEMSEIMAKQAHGAETVDTATQWALDKAKSNPLFAEEYKRQPHPIDWIVQQHKRDAVVSEIGDRSLDDFVRDYVSKNPGLLPQSAAPAAPAGVAVTATPAVPPRSIASQPSVGSAPVLKVNPVAAVEGLFLKE